MKTLKKSEDSQNAETTCLSYLCCSFFYLFAMTQLTFSDLEYGARRKQTRREKFLAEVEKVIPGERLFTLIESVYPKGKNGHLLCHLDTMLRIHFMQQWLGLSDPAIEESLYNSYSLRRFSGLSHSHGSLPDDEITILNFRRLLEKDQPAPRILAEVNGLLSEKGLLLRKGMIADVMLICDPNSTRNKSCKPDPDMHRMKKGNNWHFGVKAHTSVDADSGLVHRVTTTTANEHNITRTHTLLLGKEQDLFGDAGYTGVEKRDELKDLDVQWHVALKPSHKNTIQDNRLRKTVDRLEFLNSSVRARVEHLSRIVKRQFGCTKMRYRGLIKDIAQVLTLFALGNIWMVRGKLMKMTGQVCPKWANYPTWG